MQLVFATNNKHKMEEVARLLPPHFEIITLKEAGITEEIPEPFDTFEENAFAKAVYIYEKTGINCFAEDSGICVDALDGKPGVFSARYAGEPSDDEANLQLLLQHLAKMDNRKAYYHSTIALILDGKRYVFEGVCHGKITTSKQGNGGFGYDPIFIPQGYDRTFGELGAGVKAQISHRKQSVEYLVDFLHNLGSI